MWCLMIIPNIYTHIYIYTGTHNTCIQFCDKQMLCTLYYVPEYRMKWASHLIALQMEKIAFDLNRFNYMQRCQTCVLLLLFIYRWIEQIPLLTWLKSNLFNEHLSIHPVYTRVQICFFLFFACFYFDQFVTIE